MALNDESLCPSNLGNKVAHHIPLNSHRPLALVLSKVSGDSAIQARPKVTHWGTPPPQIT